jgi:hypothetical protein
MKLPTIKGKKLIRYGLYLIGLFLVMIIFPALFYHQEFNPLPLPSKYIKGVYHVHSNFSDGSGSLEEITRAAGQLNQDFVILTDHGNPNLLSAQSTTWLNNVLLIGGSELSLNAGLLAVFGFKVPPFRFPPEPQEAIDDINRDRGVSFVSHPFDDKIPWTDWDIREFSGIEVFNSYSFARKTGWLKLLKIPLQYLFNKRYALLNTLFYPKQNIEFWDSLNQKGKHLAIYACDAHAVLPISRTLKPHFPSYQAMFDIFNTYVKIDCDLQQDPHESARIIQSAIKRGHFFNVVEAIAPANGFEIRFVDKAGNVVETGDSTPATSGSIRLRLPFDFETDIVIKRNGGIFRKFSHNLKKDRIFEISESGIYRAEIFVSENRFKNIPWILTNPFFIGIEYPEHKLTNQLARTLLIDSDQFFSIETSPLSTGTAHTRHLSRDEWQTTFAYNLKQEPDQNDYWSALTSRKQRDFSDYAGFSFQSRAENRSRFWIEFRTQTDRGEIWYRHSFLAEPDWKNHSIPFHKFQVIRGPDKKPDLSAVYAIFISINNAIAYPDTRGSLQLKNLGLY